MNSRGFVLLPLVLTLALLGVIAAWLFEAGGTAGSIAALQQDSDELGYAAEAGYAHAKALAASAGGCGSPPALPDTSLGAYAYSASLTNGDTLPGTTYWFTAVADSWLKQSDDEGRYGADNDVRSKRRAGDHMQTVMRFDLSSLPANLDIATARLHLFVKSRDDSGQPVEIFWIDSSWSENWANWKNNNNDYDPQLVHGSFVPNEVGPLNADVTRLVRKWVSGTVPNYGIRFISTSNDKESAYASREVVSASERPRIEVVTGAATEVDVDVVARNAAGAERRLTGSLAGRSAGMLFLDYFNAGYGGNDGTRDWTADWIEIGENDGPSSGAVRVRSGKCAYGNCLKLDAGLLSTAGAWRQLSLDDTGSATLRVHTRRDGGNWTLQISSNGGANWSTLKSTGNGTDANQVRDTFDMSPYAAADTRIRFTSSQVFGFGNKDAFIDDVEIEAVCAP